MSVTMQMQRLLEGKEDPAVRRMLEQLGTMLPTLRKHLDARKAQLPSGKLAAHAPRPLRDEIAVLEALVDLLDQHRANIALHPSLAVF